MSDTIDLGLLGKMVARLQSTVEGVRKEYAGIRASLDALTTNFLSRTAEFNVRVSGLELGQMRLAASVDEAHTKIDRIELDIETLKEQQASMASRLDTMAGRQDTMDAKLDLILARLEER